MSRRSVCEQQAVLLILLMRRRRRTEGKIRVAGMSHLGQLGGGGGIKDVFPITSFRKCADVTLTAISVTSELPKRVLTVSSRKEVL